MREDLLLGPPWSFGAVIFEAVCNSCSWCAGVVSRLLIWGGGLAETGAVLNEKRTFTVPPARQGLPQASL
jgi:hypothetical protein